MLKIIALLAVLGTGCVAGDNTTAHAIAWAPHTGVYRPDMTTATEVELTSDSITFLAPEVSPGDETTYPITWQDSTIIVGYRSGSVWFTMHSSTLGWEAEVPFDGLDSQLHYVHLVMTR